MKAVESSRAYLSTFLQLMDQFNCEDEQVFPKVLIKMWKEQSSQPNYKPPRDELVQALKEKKIVEHRYANAEKIKEESDQRLSIRDFLTLQIH
jgi:hypothetical protein